MTHEVADFLERNKTKLLRNYKDYLESMVEDGAYDEMESFVEWVEEEYRVREEYEEYER